MTIMVPDIQCKLTGESVTCNYYKLVEGMTFHMHSTSLHVN